MDEVIKVRKDRLETLKDRFQVLKATLDNAEGSLKPERLRPLEMLLEKASASLFNGDLPVDFDMTDIVAVGVSLYLC